MDYQSGGGGARGCFTCESIFRILAPQSPFAIRSEWRGLHRNGIRSNFSLVIRHFLLPSNSTFEVLVLLSAMNLESLSDKPVSPLS
jgi:hypothetical protein